MSAIVSRKQQLAECEQVIADNLSGFCAVAQCLLSLSESQWEQYCRAGAALAAIHDGRLYEPEYGTWTQYLAERWDRPLPKSTARDAMTAADVIRRLQTSAIALVLPQNKSQTRALGKVVDERQPEVFNRAFESNGHRQPTGKQIEQAAAEMEEEALRALDEMPADEAFAEIEENERAAIAAAERIERKRVAETRAQLRGRCLEWAKRLRRGMATLKLCLDGLDLVDAELERGA